MTPIERQILENQRELLQLASLVVNKFMQGRFKVDALVKINRSLNKTEKLLSKEKSAEPCREMPEEQYKEKFLTRE